MKTTSYRIRLLFLILFITHCSFAQNNAVREQILIDKEWHFAFGHLYDTEKDFGHGTAYFSYLAKAGYGDGPAAASFDDRAWRLLDLPHDWAAERPFQENGSFSHGFKASGKGFPDYSIGWYRKTISIPKSDLGRIISIRFDGVFRNSKIWFNGHYLGTEESGYLGFEYDVTDYINYGGENTIAVRVDASMEEGWYYEGAGIYRHVYLSKKAPLHVAANGTYISSEIKDGKAEVRAQVTVLNKGIYQGEIEVEQTIFDPSGKQITSSTEKGTAPAFHKTAVFISAFNVDRPALWHPDHPYLYRLITRIKQNGTISDLYETTFGIRTIRFDAAEGFFINGEHLKLKGTNNHQDHAGLGTALPDGMHYFRIKKLKEMGANAYRCSHHPPAPELLDACDKLGMLVIDETRLMGINDLHLNQVRRMIERDRNHPSIFCWSAGNEEWAIESNITGERIANTMQAYIRSLDPTRPVTIGISSGFKSGISSVAEVMGYNYLGNGDIDAHRNQFKQQPGMGTEEGSTFATRGVYFTDDTKHYQSAYDRKPRPSFYSIEEGWKFYAARPYLAGMFIWTGFDYRGEPTPYGWPSVTSYFGMMDLCGFPKDNVYYLKSWWDKKPVLHIFPHWNWPGMEGREIDVRAYSNCDEVELFLNKKSMGRKKMELYGHLEWKVPYQAGALEAIGYKDGKKQLSSIQKTSGAPAKIRLTADGQDLKAPGDVIIVTAEVTSKNDEHVPVANNGLTFSISGGGKIIGLGNGDPTSLEKDRFIDELSLVPVSGLLEQPLSNAELPVQLPVLDEDKWVNAFKGRDYKHQAPAYIYRGMFDLKSTASNDKVNFFYKKIGEDALVFINGTRVDASADDSQKYLLSATILKQGKNTLHIIVRPAQKIHEWDAVNTDPGIIQMISPSEPWNRRLFNGYAQVIIQTDGSGKDIILSATGEGLRPGTVKIQQRR